MCREFASRTWISIAGDFKRLGVLGSGRPVSHDESEVRSHDCRRLHLRFLRKATYIAGSSPCTGCIVDSTALAEAEVEYEDHTSPSIW